MRAKARGSVVAFGEPNSRISAPPENSFPPPVSTIAVTFGSASARSTPFAIAVRVARPKPFSGGLSSVMTAVVPCTS